MLAAKPVIVAASVMVLTSLLSDIAFDTIDIYKSLKQINLSLLRPCHIMWHTKDRRLYQQPFGLSLTIADRYRKWQRLR